jgi:hypothetical protein
MKATSASAITRVLKSAGLLQEDYPRVKFGFRTKGCECGYRVRVTTDDGSREGIAEVAIAALKSKGYVHKAVSLGSRSVIDVYGKN